MGPLETLPFPINATMVSTNFRATGLALVLALGLALVSSVSAGPLHASCRIVYTFPSTSCKDASAAIVASINSMTHSDCGSGEKCLYTLLSSSEARIKARHETPKKHYTDTMTFEFSGSGSSCEVSAFSSSDTWYAILDFGTNYCNLHNVVSIVDAPFTEETSDSVCTQYSSANCDKY